MGVRHVEPYTEEWLRQPALYVSRVVEALGAEATDWWEGPCDPRAVTILLTGGDALVWGRGERLAPRPLRVRRP